MLKIAQNDSKLHILSPKWTVKEADHFPPKIFRKKTWCCLRIRAIHLDQKGPNSGQSRFFPVKTPFGGKRRPPQPFLLEFLALLASR